MNVLEINDLHVEFAGREQAVHAVNGVSLSIEAGVTLALVGESGSGKTVTALAVMGLLEPPGRIVSGDIKLEGHSLLELAERDYRAVRGARMTMVFQDPLSSLNPAFRIGDQVAEARRAHDRSVTRASAAKCAVELLERVGIPDAAARVRDYPHQLSGGMRQRVMIAMAVANEPALVIADEPTTALDVTIQAQVLDVLRSVQRETGAALVLVTHDLGVVAGIAERVAVMYAGRIVEEGPVDTVFANPAHPYTAGLLASTPRLDTNPRDRLPVIAGVPPSPSSSIQGCAFAPRCPLAIDVCRVSAPPFQPVGSRHASACYRWDEVLTVGARARP